MRLSDVLSNPPNNELVQIEGFLGEKNLRHGMQKKIMVGRISLPFHCHICGNVHSFLSNETLFCIGVNESTVSIDSVVTCARCEKSTVPAWFLVTSDENIFSRYPNVKIQKYSYKLSDSVSLSDERFGGLTDMLNKAQLAYAENLGAGSLVYLRKILESITFATAEVVEVETRKRNHNLRPFKEVLEEVDQKQSIIPREFSQNGYRLFEELSNVIHGDSDEQLALHKYPALKRLVIGVVENIKNHQEFNEAIDDLGWN
jgi:hypothetical protein